MAYVMLSSMFVTTIRAARRYVASDYLNAIDRKQQGAYIESINDIMYF